jgi:catechol 2,3-dioxygenase-like lactoylglutathione lyase family enzyme
MADHIRSVGRCVARVVSLSAIASFVFSAAASAQLTQAKDHRIVFGHLHVHPADYEVHRKFWVETLGGGATQVGNMKAAKVLDGVIEWESPTWANKPPVGGTKSTVVEYVAFTVQDLRAVLDRVKAAGYPIVTRTELPKAKEKDGIASDRKQSVAFVMGPDDFLVELIESKGQTAPIAMHHIQFVTPQAAEMEAWYAKIFDAKPGAPGPLVDAAIPGSHLTFTPATTPVIGTKGHVLDHIGFEIRDLEGFTKELESKGVKVERFVKTKLPNFGDISIAYITDPWGTYIELSEGLDKVQ